jgi:hypothetical protein
MKTNLETKINLIKNNFWKELEKQNYQTRVGVKVEELDNQIVIYFFTESKNNFNIMPDLFEDKYKVIKQTF